MGISRPAQVVKCSECGKTAAEAGGGWFYMCSKCGSYTCFKCNNTNQCQMKINHMTCYGSRLKANANCLAPLYFK